MAKFRARTSRNYRPVRATNRSGWHTEQHGNFMDAQSVQIFVWNQLSTVLKEFKNELLVDEVNISWKPNHFGEQACVITVPEKSSLSPMAVITVKAVN